MKHIKAIILMLLTSVICFTSFTVYAETNTLKAGILDDYSFDGNSINEYAEDSMNTILDTTASTNFIANEINFDDTTFNKGISDLQSGNIDFLCMVPVSDAFLAYVDYTSSPIATGFLGLYTTDYTQLYFEEFDTKQEAMSKEAKIKRLTRKEKLLLIENYQQEQKLNLEH